MEKSSKEEIMTRMLMIKKRYKLRQTEDEKI